MTPQVELHLLPLDVDAIRFDQLAELLSPEERLRAAGFRFDHDRRRYVVAHGRLRQLLAARLGCDPHELAFARGAHGKPLLPGSDWRFNLSHSQATGLCAIARGVEVGCDLEWQRPALATSEMIRVLYTPAERRRFAALPRQRRTDAFFRCWTAREALAKASGRGLDGFASRLDFSKLLGRSAGWFTAEPGWSLLSLSPWHQLNAAVAVQAPAFEVSLMVPGRST